MAGDETAELERARPKFARSFDDLGQEPTPKASSASTRRAVKTRSLTRAGPIRAAAARNCARTNNCRACARSASRVSRPAPRCGCRSRRRSSGRLPCRPRRWPRSSARGSAPELRARPQCALHRPRRRPPTERAKFLYIRACCEGFIARAGQDQDLDRRVEVHASADFSQAFIHGEGQGVCARLAG